MANKEKNTDRPKRRAARRVTNLNDRLNRLERERKHLEQTIKQDHYGLDLHPYSRLVVVKRKLDKTYRMKSKQDSNRTRARNRGRNGTRVNVAKAMRRVEGGAFGKGKGGQNIHSNAENFERMRAA